MNSNKNNPDENVKLSINNKDNNNNNNSNSNNPSNVDNNVVVDPEQYKELQKQFVELQTKFDKKKIIYNKINKGLKVISSYLNKKKKLEAEKKKQMKKLLVEQNFNQKQKKPIKNKKKEHRHLMTSPPPPNIQKANVVQSGDYNDYNFSEADYETTTNNDNTTPKQSLKDKISPRSAHSSEQNTNKTMALNINQTDENEYNQIKVKFAKPSLNKDYKRNEPKRHKRVSTTNLLLNNNSNNNGNGTAFFGSSQNDDPMGNTNELLDFLDNEDLTNLKELDELNRLLNGDYVSDNHMNDYEQDDENNNSTNNNNNNIGRYCESCGENVITDYSDDLGDQETSSSDSDDISSDSLDISVSGMSGWSGLSGLSNNKNEDYDEEEFDETDDENDDEEDDDNNINGKSFDNINGNGTDNLTLIKSRKSIQFDTQGEVSNQLKIHRHKINKKINRKKQNRSKSSDIDDYSMSDSSLPISRITTQNTTNSQAVSGNDEKDNEIQEQQGTELREIKREQGGINTNNNGIDMDYKMNKGEPKQKGKRLTQSGKSRQYDAIKELHRKAIKMYKKKLLKKKDRLMKKEKEKQQQQQQQQPQPQTQAVNPSLKPIDEILQTDNIPELKEYLPSASASNKLIVPTITVNNNNNNLPQNIPQTSQIFSPSMMHLHQQSFSAPSQPNNITPYGGFNPPGSIMTPQINNGGLITPFKENQMYFQMNQGNINNNNNTNNNNNNNFNNMNSITPSNNQGLYQMNNPMMNIFSQNPNINPAITNNNNNNNINNNGNTNNNNNNSMIDSPSTNLAPTDNSGMISPRNHVSVSPKYSNLRSPNTIGSNFFLKYEPKKQSIISPNYNFNSLPQVYADSNENGGMSNRTGHSTSGSSISGNNKAMSNVIQQFASVYIQPENNNNNNNNKLISRQKNQSVMSSTSESFSSNSPLKQNETNYKQTKSRKQYVKCKVILPPEFESRDVITENDLLEIYDLKLSEKVKTTVDIWLQYHEVTSKNYSFERLDAEFGKKWKIKCEPKFIKKYNRRYLLTKSVKMALERDHLQDPFIYLNKLDSILLEEKKPISYFYKKANLPKWLLGDAKKEESENIEDSE